MYKNKFIDEVVVSDRTNPMNNSMTKDTLKSAAAVGVTHVHRVSFCFLLLSASL